MAQTRLIVPKVPFNKPIPVIDIEAMSTLTPSQRQKLLRVPNADETLVTETASHATTNATRTARAQSKSKVHAKGNATSKAKTASAATKAKAKARPQQNQRPTPKRH